MELTIRLVLPHLSHRMRTSVGALLVLAFALLPAVALASDLFGDVPDALPQHDAINRVYAAGIMKACTATVPPNFCPNDPVLRAQQASQWDRALGLSGLYTPGTYVQRSVTTNRPGFVANRVDLAASNVGLYTSIAIGVDGLGLISYYDATDGDLKVAHCPNSSCTPATITTLDTGDVSVVGLYTSVTIGPAGHGMISYYDNTNSALKVARCSNLSCTSAIISTVDNPASTNVGSHTSITTGADGYAIIAYYDATNTALKAAHCSNLDCTSASVVTVDNSVAVGQYTSITIGVNGLPMISYYDATNGALKVAACASYTCGSIFAISTVDNTASTDVGRYSSMAIGSDGFPLVSYYDSTNGALKIAHCTNLACSGGLATITTIDNTANVGSHSAIAIGADGFGLVSYHDSTNGDLKVAHCLNSLCTFAVRNTVTGSGLHTSLTLGGDGFGLISFYDTAFGNLMVVHCANASCVPYHRAR